MFATAHAPSVCRLFITVLASCILAIARRCLRDHYLFQASFLGGEESPQKKLAIFPPQTAAELCALNHFIGLDNELQIHHGNFSLMNNKHRKLFVIKQSKW